MASVNKRHMKDPFRILLVEDDPADVWLVREAFRNIKSEILLSIATDGEEAIRHLEVLSNPGKDLDLILLDLNLPRTDGLQVLRYVRSNQATSRIPVLILSTSESPRDIHVAYDLHANGYLVKPRDFNQFLKLADAVEAFWLQVARLPTRVS
jgi:CheY-like chemotaxis protein